MASPSPDEAYPAGPPFPPRSPQLGGTPTPIPDIPISAVFILLFLLSALFHLLTIFLDRRRSPPTPLSKPPPPLPPNDTIATTLSRSSHYPPITDDDTDTQLPPPSHQHGSRPLPTALLFVFSLLRITALSLRIASAVHPSHLPLAIAAAEFTSAGVALLLVVNLVLAHRLVRDYCPSEGVWLKAPIRVFRFLVFAVVACLVMVVSASAEGFYLDDEDALRRAGNVQKASAVVLVFLAAAPVGERGKMGGLEEKRGAGWVEAALPVNDGNIVSSLQHIAPRTNKRTGVWRYIFIMASVQRTTAASLAAFAVIFIVNNNWFQCNVGLLNWRLQYTLESFLTALVVGISSSVIFYHNRLGKETVDTAEYQNWCLKLGAGIAVVIGIGWPGYLYCRDILALLLETLRK
ncbi:hypothetical protein B0T18DRAFT_492204 [Schizothecium vesticola]|uniref:Uncharacterized protein n=1 Tax=Schizothecium vesticola TaxID=314040 RepID=A0AA40BPS2_9PEZI|nr:hypothetical protein B0T18DRAFT_492204 [Schizothecium vesticola]